jgi:hypothetical protein
VAVPEYHSSSETEDSGSDSDDDSDKDRVERSRRFERGPLSADDVLGDDDLSAAGVDIDDDDDFDDAEKENTDDAGDVNYHPNSNQRPCVTGALGSSSIVGNGNRPIKRRGLMFEVRDKNNSSLLSESRSSNNASTNSASTNSSVQWLTTNRKDVLIE